MHTHRDTLRSSGVYFLVMPWILHIFRWKLCDNHSQTDTLHAFLEIYNYTVVTRRVYTRSREGNLHNYIKTCKKVFKFSHIGTKVGFTESFRLFFLWTRNSLRSADNFLRKIPFSNSLSLSLSLSLSRSLALSFSPPLSRNETTIENYTEELTTGKVKGSLALL